MYMYMYICMHIDNHLIIRTEYRKKKEVEKKKRVYKHITTLNSASNIMSDLYQ